MNRKQSEQTDPNEAQVLKSLRNCPLTEVFMGTKIGRKKEANPKKTQLPS